ncbi:DUF3089 domain-containing protein [soil metagenome]
MKRPLTVKRPRLTFRQWIGWLGFALVFLIIVAVSVLRGDILQSGLDPRVPFQTYVPPPAPDYTRASAWALRDARSSQSGPAAVFFVHSTTFDGGREWNGPIGDAASDAYLWRVVVPNYAGPFERAGSVSLPRYRQANLFTRLSLRRDARDARAFAYVDVQRAFEAWLRRNPTGPIVLAGVEQGGELIDRLVHDQVATDAALRARLVGVYLMDTVVAVDGLSADVPPCGARTQVGCVVAWAQVPDDDEDMARRRLNRTLIWDARGRLIELDNRPALCVNPVSGDNGSEVVPARRHLGAANATGLEWGVRPAFLTRLVSTRCIGGLLRYSAVTSESLRNDGSWADRKKARPYNLFYADIEADVQARLTAWEAAHPQAQPRGLIEAASLSRP